MKKLCLLLTMAAAFFPLARAAISVGPGGSGLITFGTAPTVAQGWATVTNTGTAADIASVAGLSSAIATNGAGRFTLAIPATAVGNPIIAQTTFAYNTVNQNLQSVAVGVAYTALLTTLQNDSGSPLNLIFISFELGEQHASGSIVTEEIPGFHVYFSLTGTPGSWQEIPGLAGDVPLGTRSSIVNLGAVWAPGAQLFLLWADDNANANRDNTGPEEGGYTIDNFLVSPNGPPPNSVTIDAPTNGSTFPQGVPLVVSAAPFMAKPVTNVAFFRDGILIGNDTSSPFSVVYTNAALGTHNLTATARDDTGASVNSSNTVQINVVSNTPPTITLVNPTNGQNFFVGQNITNLTAVSDSDGVVVNVEFYVNGVLRYIDSAPPFRFELCNALAGPHNIGAVAVDNGGMRGSNSVMITVANPMGVAILVPNGSNWKYLDDGSDQGVFWRDPAYDDSNWSSGVAELGYGDIADDRPERTQVGFGGNPNQRFATTYFRKMFNVNNPAAFTSLMLRVLRDDTAIVYLNGNQVYSDTTNTVVNYSTYAGPTAADDGTIYQVANIPLASLVPGQNVLAVEIHQSATNSPDLSFDAMLWGGGPFLRISLDPSNTANAKLDWAPANWRLQASTSVSPPSWSDIAGAAPPLVFPAPPGPRFYRIISPDGTMFSPNVVGAVPRTILPGYTLIANPLLGTNNQLGTILPLAKDGTQDDVTIIRWNVAQQNFDAAITWLLGSGWFDASFQISTQDFNPGESFVIHNPLPAPFNVVMVGDVPQGNLSNPIPANRSFLASQVPQTGTLDALGFPAKEGYQVSILNPGSDPPTYTVFEYFAGVGWTPGAPQGPTIPVGTGFIVDNPQAPQVWNRMFSVDSTPPSITQQPQSVTVLAGNSANFSVIVTGSPPISFQWFFGTNPIAGANGSTYTIPSAQLSNAGPYHVRVANAAGSLDSSNATLTVYGPIVINEWMPVNGGVVLDPADSKPDDWFELYNAGPLAVSLGGFHLTDNLSNPTKFTIPAGITIPPQGYLMFWADNQPAQGPLHVNFELPAAGSDIGVFTPGGQLMDAISYVQGTPNMSQGRLPDGDTKVFPFVGPTPNSSNAGGPPAIAVPPTNQTVTCFGTVTFVAGTAGSLPATYQWVRNGCDVVPGANSPFLTLNNVNQANAGNYSLIISNAFGRVASDDVFLGIITSPAPQLTWTNGTNAIISWPLNCPDFFIEQAPDFSSAVWASAGPVTQNGSNYFVTVPFGTNATNSVFYRLRGLDTSRITTQPIGRAAGPQENVQLSVGVSGAVSGFQWRHNGRAMFDQTNSTLFLTILSNSNYGAYEAIVFAEGMSYFSAPAFIRPKGAQTFLSDDFAGREIVTNLSATIHGTTAGATHEAGEPQHADVPGGKSVWLSWKPPASGIATFDTLGSGFDTVLAVYQVNPGGPTDLVASDDDSGGFLWSKVSFNVKANTEYAIALDGAAGTSGFFVLRWGLEITSATVPIITAQPQPVVVMSNQPALFSVMATSAPPFVGLGYQWYRNNTPIPGAIAAQFSIGSVKTNDVDDYFVVVSNGVRAVESRHALLQISSNPVDFRAEHKTLIDFVCGVPPGPSSPDALLKFSQPKVIAPSSSGSLNTAATPYNPPTGLVVCCLPPSMSPTYYTLVTVTTGGTCAAGRTSDLTFSISGMSSIAVLTVFENSVLSVPAKACATTINPTVTVAAKRNTSYSAVVVTSCSEACFTISYTNSACR